MDLGMGAALAGMAHLDGGAAQGSAAHSWVEDNQVLSDWLECPSGIRSTGIDRPRAAAHLVRQAGRLLLPQKRNLSVAVAGACMAGEQGIGELGLHEKVTVGLTAHWKCMQYLQLCWPKSM